MEITVKHKLSFQEAISRMKDLEQRLKQEYKDELQQVEVNWNDNRADVILKAMGMKAKGYMLVEEDRIYMNIKLPLILSTFKTELQNEIVKVLNEILDDRKQ
jgi:hypothetical protein